MDHGAATATPVRLDVWLDVSCLFRTRSEAKRACTGGKVQVNGQSAKPQRLLRVNDEIHITRPYGRTQTVIVRGLAVRHLMKSDARKLYEDMTPRPTPEEIEVRRLERLYRATLSPPRTPDKRDRRLLRLLKGRG
jgi:ribosome-associated heat shock protein Hsp15